MRKLTSKLGFFFGSSQSKGGIYPSNTMAKKWKNCISTEFLDVFIEKQARQIGKVLEPLPLHCNFQNISGCLSKKNSTISEHFGFNPSSTKFCFGFATFHRECDEKIFYGSSILHYPIFQKLGVEHRTIWSLLLSLEARIMKSSAETLA